MTQKERTYLSLLERALRVAQENGLIDHPAFIAIKHVIEGTNTITHRHKKRGTYYTVTGRVTLQTSKPIIDGEDLTIYRSHIDDSGWARPTEEFNDGRFEEV